MILDVDEKILISKELRKYFRGIHEIHKIKESSWSSVYHILTTNRILFCKVGPLAGAVTHEYQILAFLRAQGLRCVPEILSYSEIGGKALLVTRFIKETGYYNVRKLAENFAKVHALKHKDETCKNFPIEFILGMENELSDLQYIWGKENPKRVRLMNKLGDALKQMRVLYKKRKQLFAQEPLRLIQMDAQDVVIPSVNEMYLVDWHLARYGDPACDLARLFIYEQDKTKKFDRDEFIKMYARGIPVNDSLLWRINYFHLGSLVAMLLYSFGDSVNLVRYKSSPLVVQQSEKDFFRRLLDKKIENNFDQIYLMLERLGH